MSRNWRIGIWLIVLGVFGVFYLADELFPSYSGAWNSIIIISLIIAAIGLVLLWREWGRKSK